MIDDADVRDPLHADGDDAQPWFAGQRTFLRAPLDRTWTASGRA